MKLMIKISCFIIFSIPVESQAFSNARNKDPIDVEYEKCLNDAGGAPPSVLGCINQAKDKWDKELNRVYKKVIKSKKFLNGRAAFSKKPLNINKIIEAQRSWIQFRDKHEAALAEVMAPLIDGFIWATMLEDGLIDIIRARTEQLKAYLHYIDQYDSNSS